MRSTALLLGTISLTFLTAAPGRGQAPASGANPALYAADRPVDFVHMRLELTFTPDGLRARTCEGRVEYTLRPRATPVTTVRLDAADLRILGVEQPGAAAPRFAHDDRTLTVQLAKPIPQGDSFKLAIRYRIADPALGMHFLLPSASRPKRPLTVYTQGESLQSRYWVPTHDWPNQRTTSDIIVTVPSPLTAVAPGVLVSRKPVAEGKSVEFHWRNEVPTTMHHVGIAVGELVELKDEWRGRPVRVFTPPGSEAVAKATFRHVPEILDLYTKLTGVEFPYPGYTHVVVPGHHHGGMEHAGLSFVALEHLTAGEDGETSLEHTESVYVSHMLAHQWFGGIVNYRTVPHAWLNEGFAILLDSTWTTQTDHPERFPCKMWQTAQFLVRFDSSETGLPLVIRDFKDPNDVFQLDGGKVYYKGAWVLQMLRHQLGEELFWRGVAKYLNDHRWQGVETSDLRHALEGVSGRDLEQFFQQWVFGRGVPRLAVGYAWDVAAKRATVTVRQTQKIDAATPAFVFPLDLAFRVGGATKTHTVTVTRPQHEFTFDFTDTPDLFCVDPNGGLLKTLEVTAPRAMLCRQVRSGPTALSRMMAAEALARQAGPDAIDALQQSLEDEKEFWMVRAAAAESLGRLQTPAARAALLAAEQKGLANPRALAALVSALGTFTLSPDTHAVVMRYAAGHASRTVQHDAVAALARLRANPELVTRSVEVLTATAQRPTRRTVRLAAIHSIGTFDDPRCFETINAIAQPGGDDDLRNLAIPVLGRLGRRDGLRERALGALVGWLEDPDEAAQEAAARGLGSLGDARAVEQLERVRDSSRHEELRTAARQAIEAIRRPPGDSRAANAALLQRLDAIEKRNRELETKLADLTRKLAPPKSEKK